jgi:hypothetical protein
LTAYAQTWLSPILSRTLMELAHIFHRHFSASASTK